MTWDTSIEMVGKCEVYWAVTRGEDGNVEVYLSPYQQLPDPPGTESEERRGLTTFLKHPLSTYSDKEIGIAASVMTELAMEDFIDAMLINRIAKALREQREREGGYVAPETPHLEQDEAEEA